MKVYTPPEVAKILKVSRDKILAWIRIGDLKAFNTSKAKRPRYRISKDAVEDFMEERQVVRASQTKGYF